MATNRIIPLGQVVAGKFEPDNTVATPELRLVGGTHPTNTISGSFIGNGRYKFLAIPDGRYVFFSDGTALNNVLGSVAEGGEWIGDEALPYLPHNGTNYDAGNYQIKNVGNDTTPTSALNVTTADNRYIQLDGGGVMLSPLSSIDMSDAPIYGLPDTTPLTTTAVSRNNADALYMGLTGNQTIAGIKTFSGNNVFTGTNTFRNTSVGTGYKLTLTDAPVAGTDAANRTYVLSTLNSFSVPSYVESMNVVRLMPGEIDSSSSQGNTVFTEWTDAQDYCDSIATANKRMTIKVEGAGITSGGVPEIIVSANVSDYFNSYVSVVGISGLIILKIPSAPMSTTTAHTCMIENVIIKDAAFANPTMTGFQFKNVIFDLVGSDMIFDNCIFHGVCVIKQASAAVTFTSCKGGYVRTNATLPATISGNGGITAANLL